MQPTLTPREVIKGQCREICDRHGVQVDDVIGPSRSRRLIPARTEVYTFLRYEKGWSCSRIGQFMSGRHHTAIVHAIRKARRAQEGA